MVDTTLAKWAGFCALLVAMAGLADSAVLAVPAPKDGCDNLCRQIPGPFMVNGGVGCFREQPDSCRQCAMDGYRCKSGTGVGNCVGVFDSNNQPWIIPGWNLVNDNGPPCTRRCDEGTQGAEASKNDGTYDGLQIQGQQYECK